MTQMQVETGESRRADAGQGLILIVDDDAQIRSLVRRCLATAGYDVEEFPDGEACLEGLSRSMPHAICLDLDMPHLGGLDTLKQIKARHRHLPVIILTGDQSVDSAVAAMQEGAYDYVVKPFNAADLLTRIKNAVERYRMSLRLSELERAVDQQGYPGIVGSSTVMKELYRQMDRLAACDIAVLIQGESGTGKELVARAIHESSGRRQGPFVALNCAAIPETLQESEMFGHEKGAFTGATARYRGRFEQAHEGTLFLDEVAELNLPLQAKLLRVLQDKRFHRLGSNEEIRSDFRLIAATHRNLVEAVRLKLFREDLFFRVAVVELEVPPLRERGNDILALAERFLSEASQKHAGGKDRSLAPDTLDVLKQYPWPGNVRELHNVIQRAVVLSGRDEILPEDLPARVLKAVGANGGDISRLESPSPESSKSSSADDAEVASLNLDVVERRTIERALRRSRGNLSEVGRMLGVSRNTLYRKLEKHGLHELRTTMRRSSR